MPSDREIFAIELVLWVFVYLWAGATSYHLAKWLFSWLIPNEPWTQADARKWGLSMLMAWPAMWCVLSLPVLMAPFMMLYHDTQTPTAEAPSGEARG